MIYVQKFVVIAGFNSAILQSLNGNIVEKGIDSFEIEERTRFIVPF